ncbi:MAG: DNA primase [Chromatiaceae bacterium]|jgi:DNA primase|nr:DNA primase [Chromatiaceae bacterium]
MAGRIPPDFIDALLARTDIVDLINRRVPLRKAGKDYQACCPFHDEKTPSFTVSREKQFYHCFGCGAHGSAIGFLMEYERLGFLDAVEDLAREAGLELPKEAEAGPAAPDLAPLYRVLGEAAQHFRRQLRSHPEAARAVEYLKGRGLTGEIAATFGVGYAAPGWDLLLALLGADAKARRLLLDAGLVIEQEGKRYDRFRDRIIFPIRDRRGRVIGFGGRILGDGKPKYLNSPETPIFHKGRELYGLYEAQQANRRLERVLVVEGYLDVIALAQFGITCACATLGTATTPEHLQRLLRTAPEVVFCFDGDRAGRAAAWKALQTALPLATGRQQIRFLFLPEGEDPDTLVRKEGREGFEQRLQRARPLSELLFDQLAEGVDLATIDGRARLAALAEPLIGQVPAGLYRDMLAGRLAALVGVEPARVGGGPARSKAPRRRPGPSRQTLPPLRLAIALLLQHPELAPAAVAEPDDWRALERPGVSLLAELIDLVAAYPGLSAGALLERWRDSEQYNHLQRLADPALLRHIPAEGREAELLGALGRLVAEMRDATTASLLTRATPSQLTEEEKAQMRRLLSRPRDDPGAKS